MRQIHKKSPPQALTQWRQARLAFPPAPGMVCNYEELRKAKAVLNALEQQLLKEQGGLCAYTGLQLRNKFHLEHLVPQKYCHYGQDAAYTNLVACWPAPNPPSKTPYGAQKKDDWPAPSQSHLFVSPLVTACHQRFTFNSRGQIKATQNTDLAAQVTIVNLGLDHPELTALRRQALQGALSPLKKKAAYQRRLTALQQQETQLLSGQWSVGPTFRVLFCSIRCSSTALGKALKRHHCTPAKIPLQGVGVGTGPGSGIGFVSPGQRRGATG